MSETPQVTITVTDDIIDRAVARLLRVPECEESECDECVERSAIDIEKMVRKEVAKRIDKEICVAIQATARDVVERRVVEILDAGFPTFSQWGEKSGTKTLAQIVGEAVFSKPDNYSKNLKELARDHMVKYVEQVVREHVKSLDGDIRSSMKAAAAEALQKWMASTLGVRS